MVSRDFLCLGVIYVCNVILFICMLDVVPLGEEVDQTLELEGQLILFGVALNDRYDVVHAFGDSTEGLGEFLEIHLHVSKGLLHTPYLSDPTSSMTICTLRV